MHAAHPRKLGVLMLTFCLSTGWQWMTETQPAEGSELNGYGVEANEPSREEDAIDQGSPVVSAQPVVRSVPERSDR